MKDESSRGSEGRPGSSVGLGSSTSSKDFWGITLISTVGGIVVALMIVNLLLGSHTGLGGWIYGTIAVLAVLSIFTIYPLWMTVTRYHEWRAEVARANAKAEGTSSEWTRADYRMAANVAITVPSITLLLCLTYYLHRCGGSTWARFHQSMNDPFMETIFLLLIWGVPELVGYILWRRVQRNKPGASPGV